MANRILALLLVSCAFLAVFADPILEPTKDSDVSSLTEVDSIGDTWERTKRASGDESKCVKDAVKSFSTGSNREATDAEIRILLNRKGLPNELVGMVVNERNKLRKSDPRVKNPPKFIPSRLRLSSSCNPLIFSSKKGPLSGGIKKKPFKKPRGI